MSRGKYKRRRRNATDRANKMELQSRLKTTELISSTYQVAVPDQSFAFTRYNRDEKFMELRYFIGFFKRSSFTDWCLAIFTCALVVVSFRQLQVMRVDQRAWMSIKIDGVPKVPIEGATFDAVAHVMNTGKTPATDVHVDITIEKVRNGESPDLRFLGRIFNAEISGIYLPNQSSDIPFSLLSIDPRNSAPIRLSRDDVNDLLQGKTFIVMFGGVDYTDVFGTRHWVRTCSWTGYGTPITGYSAEPCAAFNAIDNNR